MDDVPFTLPVRRAMFGSLTPLQRLRRRVEDVLVGLGLSEIYTPSLVPAAAEPDGLALPDPMGDQAVLRQTLLHGLLDAAARNVVGRRTSGSALFEIARVYLPRGDELPEEQLHVGGIVEGGFARGQGSRRGALPGAQGRARASSATPGRFSTRAAPRASTRAGSASCTRALLEGTWGAFELDLEALLAALARADPVRGRDHVPGGQAGSRVRRRRGVCRPATWSPPPARRPGRSCASCASSTSTAASRSAQGKKSIALAAAFQSPERTLSDEDAAAIRERIVDGARASSSARSCAPRVGHNPIALRTVVGGVMRLQGSHRRSRRSPRPSCSLPRRRRPRRDASSDGTVGPGFSIRLDAPGRLDRHAARPRHLRRSSSRDLAVEHNFHLTGPGVDRRPRSRRPGRRHLDRHVRDGRYHFVCDPHSTTMRGEFVVGNPPPPTDPPPPPARRRRSSCATVGPAATISLTQRGRQGAGGLKARHLPIIVRDRSEAAQLPPDRPGRQPQDRPRREGTLTWKVKLSAGLSASAPTAARDASRARSGSR